MKIIKTSKIFSRIFEIYHYVLALLLLIGSILAYAAPEIYKNLFQIPEYGNFDMTIKIYSMESTIQVVNGIINPHGLFIAFFVGFIILTLLGISFRNLYLILKNTEKRKTFSMNNIRLLKEISIFNLIIPVIVIISNIVSKIILKDAFSGDINLVFFILSFIVFVLMEIFKHGKDFDTVPSEDL